MLREVHAPTLTHVRHNKGGCRMPVSHLELVNFSFPARLAAEAGKLYGIFFLTAGLRRASWLAINLSQKTHAQIRRIGQRAQLEARAPKSSPIH